MAKDSDTVYTPERIADAIYLAEGGSKTKHPYGILSIKTDNPRKVCINTINNHIKRHRLHACGKDFIACLGDRYCPVNASNDLTGLNKNWVRNVKRFLKER